jgi:hypothetical protein
MPKTLRVYRAHEVKKNIIKICRRHCPRYFADPFSKLTGSITGLSMYQAIDFHHYYVIGIEISIG